MTMCKTKTESVLLTAQNNIVRINCVKEKVDNALEDSKWRLCCTNDEKDN